MIPKIYTSIPSISLPAFCIIWMHLLFLIPSVHPAKDCCSSDNTYNFNSSLCSDDNDISINCSVAFFELPSTRINDLKEDDDHSIIAVSDMERLLPEDKFCILEYFNYTRTVLVCESETEKYKFANAMDETEEIVTGMWKFYLYSVLMTVSGIFLILTILTYASFSELWNIQDKLFMYTIFSLLVVFMTYNVVHLNPYLLDYHRYCVTLAFLLYFASLSTYFWLNILGFNIWRQIWFRRLGIKDANLFIVYNIIGWGVPSAFVFAAMITHGTVGNHLRPGFGDEGCWFSDIKQLWTYCTGPMAILLTLDVLYITLSSYKLCGTVRMFDQLRLKTLKYRRTMYAKLVFIMAFDWIDEIITSLVPYDYISIPLDILNTSQGIFIFIVLVYNRSKVKKILAIKKPWGINFPKSWTELPDQEYDTMLSNAMQSVVMANAHMTFFVY